MGEGQKYTTIQLYQMDSYKKIYLSKTKSVQKRAILEDMTLMRWLLLVLYSRVNHFSTWLFVCLLLLFIYHLLDVTTHFGFLFNVDLKVAYTSGPIFEKIIKRYPIFSLRINYNQIDQKHK